jgi:hypothetical protein
MRKAAPLVVLIIALVSSARVIATYRVFTNTYDEPWVIACGMEWLQRTVYTFEHLHPPLFRVAAALGPYLSGVRMGYDPWGEIGPNIPYSGDYFRVLSLARIGTQPFLLLAIVVVWFWARHLLGVQGGLAAVLLFATLPPILGHGGIAGNDLPLAACLATALYAFARWVEKPSPLASVALGISIALTYLSKLSELTFFPLGVLAIWAFRRREAGGEDTSNAGALLRPACMVLLVAGFVFWAGYRFSFAPVADAASYVPSGTHKRLARIPILDRTAVALSERLPVPAPEAFSALLALKGRLAAEEDSYLFGRVVKNGRWIFSRVVFTLKTPLPFLVLLLVGALSAVRRGETMGKRALAPLGAALLILLSCLPSRINLGVRCILAVYPLIAIVAAAGALELWRRNSSPRLGRLAVVLLLASQVAVSAAAHPDYLAYFNPLAGSDPGRVDAESDLDWGQDRGRLGREVERRGITEIHLAYFGSARPDRHIPARIVATHPDVRPRGWVAVSENLYRFTPDDFPWLRGVTPVCHVGRSILLYYLPGDGERKRAAGT